MFTRRKHNRSGTISVVVVDKSGGGFKEIHRVGVAHSEEEAAALEAEGRHWIATYGGQQLIDFEGRADKELRTAEDVLSSITSTRLSAAQTIIGKVYDSIGFDEIEDEELRHLVIGRICQPMSKKATVDYLRRHFKDDVSLQKIYRYMDKLNNTQKDRVQEISVRHTQTLFGGNIGILFYDVTTLYFETTDKDELRNNGFSKDGKNANPQVVLGLLVSRGGYPLSYALFNGAQFEGYTMIPIVDDFIQRYNLGSDFVVIADSGLMSEKNVQLLRSAGYKYIIGARIKKESGAMKDLNAARAGRLQRYPVWQRRPPHRRLLGGPCEEERARQERGCRAPQKAIRKGNLDQSRHQQTRVRQVPQHQFRSLGPHRRGQGLGWSQGL